MWERALPAKTFAPAVLAVFGKGCRKLFQIKPISSASRFARERPTHFSLLRQRKVSKRKAGRPALVYLNETCGARSMQVARQLAGRIGVRFAHLIRLGLGTPRYSATEMVSARLAISCSVPACLSAPRSPPTALKNKSGKAKAEKQSPADAGLCVARMKRSGIREGIMSTNRINRRRLSHTILFNRNLLEILITLRQFQGRAVLDLAGIPIGGEGGKSRFVRFSLRS